MDNLETFVQSIKDNRLYHGSCISLTGKMLKEYFSPCIYGWRDENGWLYIGKSFLSGFSRITTHISEKNNQLYKEIKDDYQVFIWLFPNIEESELLYLERRLIFELQPELNVTHRKSCRLLNGDLLSVEELIEPIKAQPKKRIRINHKELKARYDKLYGKGE